MDKKDRNSFSLKERFKSFKYAFNGFGILFREEHNSRIHLVVSSVVILGAIVLDISSTEWLIILVLIALVFTLEIVNSAIENLADYITADWNQKIKKVKDLMAAAVFFASLISVICGSIIFIPKICDFITSN